MKKNTLFAIIVAGGSGSRMESTMPKQFIPIAGYPVLMHTLRSFKAIKETIDIILVLPKEQFANWKNLCEQYEFKIPHKIVEGGNTRGESVKNGLKILPDHGIVAIHDGVRPFVSIPTIEESFKTAEKFGAAVAAVDLKDSIREITESGSKAVKREAFKIVQTPQTFRISLIKDAYNKATISYSDDAAVAEAAGYKVELIKGSYDNIKITTPEDLIIAQEILKRL